MNDSQQEALQKALERTGRQLIESVENSIRQWQRRQLSSGRHSRLPPKACRDGLPILTAGNTSLIPQR